MLAFQAWTRDKSRSLADQLVARGDLDADARAGFDAIVALHVKKHGDVEKSLAAVPAGRSTREGLAGLGDPDIEGTLRHCGLDTRLDRRGRFRPHNLLRRSASRPATASGSASSGRTPGAGWGRCSWRWMRNCTARSRSSRSSTTTPTTRPAASGS